MSSGVSDRAVEEFQRTRHLYEQLGDEVIYELDQVLRDRDLNGQIHGGVTYRVKEVDSFREKISRKPYSDPISETRDLLGVRIVCLYPSVLEEIDKVITDTFKVLRYEDKVQADSPELWRYAAKHYDCQLAEDCSGARYDKIKGLAFEIQVRTILQDAWATVEHKLGYKSERQIPDELKREFSALAGLFHVADQRFQFIADRMQTRSQDVAKQLAALYRAAIERDLTNNSGIPDSSLEMKMKELESRADAILHRGAAKALLHGLYAGRKRARNYDYSVFVQDLESAEITTLGALGRLLMTGDSAVRDKEGKADDLNDVEFARLAISVTLPKFQNTRKR